MRHHLLQFLAQTIQKILVYFSTSDDMGAFDGPYKSFPSEENKSLYSHSSSDIIINPKRSKRTDLIVVQPNIIFPLKML